MKNTLYRLSAIAAVLLAAGCADAPSARISTAALPTRSAAQAALTATPAEPLKIQPATPGTASAADAAAVRAMMRPVARHASRAWHGSRTVDVQDDEVLPPIFNEVFKLEFDDRNNGGRVSINVAAERISRLSGVLVRVKSDVFGAAGAARAPIPVSNPAMGMAPAPFPLPSGSPGGMKPPGPTGSTPPSSQLVPSPALSAPQVPAYYQPTTDVSSLEMKWNGTLAGFLDNTTSRLGLSWSYRDGVVVIERYITETFEMATFGGEQDYKMGLSGGNSGGSTAGGQSSSASSTLNLTENGKLAILDSLRQAVETMVKPAGGSVVLNEGTGRFFVTAPKDVMARVREIIKTEDASLQRQAMIQFDIYSVVTNDSNEVGVDWNVVLKNMTSAIGATIRSPATLTTTVGGGLGVNILSGVGNQASTKLGNSAVMLNLLSQVGSNALYRPVSLVALNRQWARKTNLNTDGYLSETTPSTSSSAGSGAPGLKTSSITTGDKIMVQPAIMDNGSIILKFGISLSELLGLFDQTAGTGQSFQKVQTPNTSGTDDQGTIRLNPGEAMVVTGLSRRKATGDSRTLGENISAGLGGSRKDGYKREDFLIVVRAVQF